MKKNICIYSIFLVIIFSGCRNHIQNDEISPNECTKYACPMHPDKISATPAKCPICNMEMQPVAAGKRKDSADVKKQ